MNTAAASSALQQMDHLAWARALASSLSLEEEIREWMSWRPTMDGSADDELAR